MCGATRANFWLRTVRPDLIRSFAEHHDASVSQCMVQLMSVDLLELSPTLASLPFRLGGVGVAHAVRGREAAHWASWADCIKMVKQRHPHIAATMMRSLVDHDPVAPCFREVRSCQRSLMEAGFDIPEWESLTESPPPRQEGEIEPSQPKRGWQHKATHAVDDTFFWNQVWPNLSQADQALQRSQCIPLASPTWTAVFAHLQMWPLLGHSWPSSSSVCASRGSGPKRFPLRVCSGSGLQRSRRESVHECVCPRSGHCRPRKI